MSTTTPNLNLIQPSKSEKGGWTTYTTNNQTIDAAYGEYLDDREQSLENIAPIEGTTASKNYTVGSYLVKDGGLYKVTVAIASGERIVVGTNVIATSLNDAVVELNTAVATLQGLLSTKLSVSGLDVSRSNVGYLGNGFYFDMYKGNDKYTAVFNFNRKSIIIRKNDVDVKEWS